MSHTGGFTDYPKDFDYRKDYTEADLLKIVYKNPAGVSAGNEMELQQSRISDAGHTDSSCDRHILWRRITGENLSAAGNEYDAHHE